MNKKEISLAKPTDSKLLSVLFKTVYINTYGTAGVTDEFANFITTQFSPEKIATDIESSECDLWVARFVGNPVAVIKVDYNKPCPIGKAAHPEINKLYTLQQFFGQGIGQGLMQTAEKALASNGHKQVWLWVLETNKRAVNFYSKQGYQYIGTAYFQMEENRYKNIVMSKQL